MDRGRLVLIVAASGRALAASARRAGYLPLVADGFGDQDMLAVADDHVRVDLGRGSDDEELIEALDRLATGRRCTGIVCGSGFEDRADVLARIAARWALLGNSAQTVAQLKDPLAFAAICWAADIPHPETSVTLPPDPVNWLVKRIGGAGGWHICPAETDAKPRAGLYYQQRIDGTPISALLLGNGRDVIVLGFSEQWCAPTARHPFRYGGAVRPAALSGEMAQALTAAVQRLNEVVPLVGLNSADFLVTDEAFHLLEINPRPSATFDLFDTRDTPLFSLHVDACGGKLPECAPAYEGAMAGAIVYAQERIERAPDIEWPDWATDRPTAGSHINKDQPLCSVFARAATADAARQLVEERGATIHALLRAGAS